MVKFNGITTTCFDLPWYKPVSEIWSYARNITGRLHDDLLVNRTIEVHFNDITNNNGGGEGTSGGGTAPPLGVWGVGGSFFVRFRL